MGSLLDNAKSLLLTYFPTGTNNFTIKFVKLNKEEEEEQEKQDEGGGGEEGHCLKIQKQRRSTKSVESIHRPAATKCRRQSADRRQIADYKMQTMTKYKYTK